MSAGPERIAVIGASRGLGAETVRAALRSGHPVTGLSRTQPEIEHADLRSLTATLAINPSSKRPSTAPTA